MNRGSTELSKPKSPVWLLRHRQEEGHWGDKWGEAGSLGRQGSGLVMLGMGSVFIFRVLGNHQVILSRKGGVCISKRSLSHTEHKLATDPSGRWRNDGGLDRLVVVEI